MLFFAGRQDASVCVYFKIYEMKEFLNKNEGHSLVVMTADSFQKAMEVVYARAKEAALAEINARSSQEKDCLISKSEAMGILRKSSNTLWKWARRCYLKPVKVGGRVMYRLADIDRILEHQS